MLRSARRTGPDTETVRTVLARSGWACERCGAGLSGERGSGWSVHHRRARGMGGTRREDSNAPQNLLVACGSGTTGCHGEIERNRAHAQSTGWLVPSVLDPAKCPVLICGDRWRYLTDFDYSLDPPDGTW